MFLDDFHDNIEIPVKQMYRKIKSAFTFTQHKEYNNGIPVQNIKKNFSTKHQNII